MRLRTTRGTPSLHPLTAHAPPPDASEERHEDAILLIADGFATLNGRDHNALAAYALAKQLARDGHRVDVLYTGPATPQFASLAWRYFADESRRILRCAPTRVDWRSPRGGGSSLEKG